MNYDYKVFAAGRVNIIYEHAGRATVPAQNNK